MTLTCRAGFPTGSLDSSPPRSAVGPTRLGIISDVAQAYLNLKRAEQRAVTAAAEVANPEGSLRLSQGRYRAGVGVLTDVIDAQNDLDTANTNQVNARSEIDQARAALAYATGNASLR